MKWTAEKQAEAEFLRAAGLFYESIAGKLGVSEATIRRWLSRDGKERDRERNRWKYQNDQKYRERVLSLKREQYLTTWASPFVYAIHSQVNGLLKVGKSTRSRDGKAALAMGHARMIVRQRNMPAEDLMQIWARSGSEVAEAYIQVFLSLKYPQTLRNRIRLSEWFSVQASSVEDIVLELDRIYRQMPEEMKTLHGLW